LLESSAICVAAAVGELGMSVNKIERTKLGIVSAKIGIAFLVFGWCRRGRGSRWMYVMTGISILCRRWAVRNGLVAQILDGVTRSDRSSFSLFLLSPFTLVATTTG
jgi:hypothetical protein